MCTHNLILAGLLTSLAVGRPLQAQQLKVEPDQRYLILEVARVSTLEKELNAAGQLGFQVKMSTAAGNKVEVLMERPEPSGTFQYRVVSTFRKKTGEQEMNDAAAGGFRVVPHTFLNKSGLTAYDVSAVVIMEKVANVASLYEYKSIGALNTPILDKELKAAVSEGWTAVGLRYAGVVLERLRR